VPALIESLGLEGAIEFVTGVTDERIVELYAEAEVAVVPGEAFGTASHIRISYATSMHELERGLDRLQKFIEAL